MRINKVSKEKEVERFWSRIPHQIEGDCWEWQGRINQDGYGQFDHNNSCSSSHRYVWKLFYGDIPDGMVICHKCDNPPCCNPAHLFLGTVWDNVRDRDLKGRQASHKGEKNGRAKLNRNQAVQIRKLRQVGLSYKELAKRFSVSIGCISHIINGRHWI